MRITIVSGPFLPVPTLLGGAVEKVQSRLAMAYAAAGHEVILISRAFRKLPRKETVHGVLYVRVRSFNRRASIWANLLLTALYDIGVLFFLKPSDVVVTNSVFLPLILSRFRKGHVIVHVARFPKGQMLMYNRAAGLHVPSNEVAAAIASQAPRLVPRVFVVPYPIADMYFGGTDRPPRQKRVLYVGRVAREKGLNLLVKAFVLACADPQLKDWELRIVGPYETRAGGDGLAYLQELSDLATPLGSACKFIGPLFEEAALVLEYRSASVFVYPSVAETGETFGLAPLEAMAAGCATVLSNLRCFKEFGVDGESCLVFDHRSAKPDSELSDRLVRLMKDPDLVRSLSTKGETMARRFSVDSVARSLLDEFRRVCAAPDR